MATIITAIHWFEKIATITAVPIRNIKVGANQEKFLEYIIFLNHSMSNSFHFLIYPLKISVVTPFHLINCVTYYFVRCPDNFVTSLLLKKLYFRICYHFLLSSFEILEFGCYLVSVGKAIKVNKEIKFFQSVR